MKERPILFSAPMVRAILDGSKTQTRRVVKPQPPATVRDFCTFHNPKGEGLAHFAFDPVERELQDWFAVCPYGQPGDRLWVRETFSPIYPQDPTYNGGRPIEYDYSATYKHGDRLGDSLGIKKVWKPSIHMPRAASRITLEITGVRVERLQDISEADVIAEGIRRRPLGFRVELSGAPKHESRSFYTAISAFRFLWESINGPGSWDANPWVWVIDFKQVTP